jgi:hypothetical protein
MGAAGEGAETGSAAPIRKLVLLWDIQGALPDASGMLPELGPFAQCSRGRIRGIGADCRPGLVDAAGNGSPRGPGGGDDDEADHDGALRRGDGGERALADGD